MKKLLLVLASTVALSGCASTLANLSGSSSSTLDDTPIVSEGPPDFSAGWIASKRYVGAEH